jgi:transmembrane sensor
VTTGGPEGGNLDRQRFEVACDWFLRLRESHESTELIAEWLAWCRADARNPAAFEEVRALWWATRAVTPLPESDNHLVPQASATGAARPRWWTRWTLAAAIALALIATGSIVRFVTHGAGNASASMILVTEQKEHRSFQLRDGSRVELAGDSRVSVRLEADSRQLVLERGEAYFKVAHDRTRPFVVAAGATHVTAVGTSFNVRAGFDHVVVAVDEGVVVVEPGARDGMGETGSPRAVTSPAEPSHAIRLRRGQEVSVGVKNHELEFTSIEPAAVASWREGRLRFAREPLRSVIASVLAASGQQIVLTDPALGDLRFTGTVFSSRVADWAQGLPSIYPVTVRMEGEEFVVEPRE